MRHIISTEPPLALFRVGGVLNAGVETAALCVLRAVVIQPGVGVAYTELKAVREALLQNRLQGMVDAISGRDTPPHNILVLRIAPQRLGYVPVEGGIR